MKTLIVLIIMTFATLSFATPKKLYSTEGESGQWPECSIGSYIGTDRLVGNEKFDWLLRGWNVKVWVKDGKVSKVSSTSKELTDSVYKILNQTFYAEDNCVMKLGVKL
jgi:hypothetical protein